MTPPKATPLNPDDKIVMARFGAPRGINGDIRLRLFCRDAAFFLQQPYWWCRRAGADNNAWRQQAVERCRDYNGEWCARLRGVTDRDAAAAWRLGDAALARGELPPPADDEYYWCDLIGLTAVNAAGDNLGTVESVFCAGASDVLRARAADGKELLIPFAADYVLRVDFAARCVRVNWERDW